MTSHGQRIQQALDDDDELQLMIHELVARSREWSTLYRQLLRAALAQDSRNRDDGKLNDASTPEDDKTTFTQEDLERVEQLREELLEDMTRVSSRFMSLPRDL